LELTTLIECVAFTARAASRARERASAGARRSTIALARERARAVAPPRRGGVRRANERCVGRPGDCPADRDARARRNEQSLESFTRRETR
jgi:hypothetical protein